MYLTRHSPNAPSRRRDFTIALGLSGIFLLITGLATAATREIALFSLLPPGGSVADIKESARSDLHFTFFTVWASMVLATPALAMLPRSYTSAAAFRWWRILWTASLMVFALHFYWSTQIIFEGNWSRILDTSRVSAPRLDTLFGVWWCGDVLLAWTTRKPGRWIGVQRWGVHLLALLLFFMGAAREGELPLSRWLGWTMAAVVVAAFTGWITDRLRKGRPAP